MDNCGNSCGGGCMGFLGGENVWLIIAVLIIVFALLGGENERC